MSKKKRKSTIRIGLPKPKVEPVEVKETVKTKALLTPPEFPTELNYYDAAKIEKFRSDYKAFVKAYMASKG